MDSYIFSRPYSYSFIDSIDMTPYKWLKTIDYQVYGICIDIQNAIYNKDALIIQGYKIEKALRVVYPHYYIDGE